jgi:hypothetical protein
VRKQKTPNKKGQRENQAGKKRAGKGPRPTRRSQRKKIQKLPLVRSESDSAMLVGTRQQSSTPKKFIAKTANSSPLDLHLPVDSCTTGCWLSHSK